MGNRENETPELDNTADCAENISIGIRRSSALSSQNDHPRPWVPAQPLSQARPLRRCRRGRYTSSWMTAGPLQKMQIFWMIAG
jgi:hypothetical protein